MDSEGIDNPETKKVRLIHLDRSLLFENASLDLTDSAVVSQILPDSLKRKKHRFHLNELKNAIHGVLIA